MRSPICAGDRTVATDAEAPVTLVIAQPVVQAVQEVPGADQERMIAGSDEVAERPVGPESGILGILGIGAQVSHQPVCVGVIADRSTHRR